VVSSEWMLISLGISQDGGYFVLRNELGSDKVSCTK
jgi:hypothetical protein